MSDHARDRGDSEPQVPRPAGEVPFELGVYSFAELTPVPGSERMLTPAERMRDLLEEIELADQVGLDVYGLGEHHRPEYISSSPATILAAAAARTERIRLTSAVTVLSSDDPVRAFQQFATLDLISGGRAELMAGRGSFIESFPLFGYDLRDYDRLFEEKLDLLLAMRSREKVTWSGSTRPPLEEAGVYPRPLQDPLPVWIAVGGTPQSVMRAARLGLPLALAIIGGYPERFLPYVELYRETAERAGHDASRLPVSINSHGFIAKDDRLAADQAFPSVKLVMDRLGRERGWPPLTRERFEAERDLRAHLAVGDPERIIEKILLQHEIFAHDRYLLQLTVGSMPHRSVLEAIELLGTVVAPAVRQEVARRRAGTVDS